MIPPEAQADFLEFLWIWNQSQELNTPGLHRRMARWLQARHLAGERRLLLMAFRGSGKSSIVGLYCAWWLHRLPDARILVLAADQLLAIRMVSNVRRIIERHPLCAALRPDAPDAWAMDRFTVARPAVLRDPSMLAQGISGNITGARAELIICDDVEVAGNCDTPGKREELRERLAETEFVLTPGGLILFVGTPHTAETLYDTAGFLRGYRRLALPVMDAAGRSAWPERFPRAEIEALRERTGPRHFTRQMLLQAVSDEAARLDPRVLVRYAEEPEYTEAGGRMLLTLLGRRLVFGGGYWDPAFGKPGQGDASVLAVTFADGEGNTYLHRLVWLTHRPDSAIDPATQQCQQVAAMARDLLLPVVRVETNGLGKFLPDLLKRELARSNAACAVVEQVNHRPKQERILAALDPAMAARRLHAHDSVLAGRFPAEMAAWRPNSAGVQDDALDALAGAMLAEPVRLPWLPPGQRLANWRGG